MLKRTKSLLDSLNKLPKYSLSIITFTVILILCWLPASSIQEPKWFHIPNADKIIHFILFFVWAFCLTIDFSSKYKSGYKLTLFILAVSAATAILTECLQPVLSNRTSDLSDGLADMAGSLCLCLVYLQTRKKHL
jgi:VanZ family protein